MITELRRYRIKPGRMDSWVAFFREAARANEACGIRVEYAGVEPETNTFVWLRSFDDEAVRVARKATFYGSDWWLEREAFAMDHVEAYAVEFLEAALVHDAPTIAYAPPVAPGPAAGSTPDDPPSGWIRTTRASWHPASEAGSAG